MYVAITAIVQFLTQTSLKMALLAIVILGGHNKPELVPQRLKVVFYHLCSCWFYKNQYTGFIYDIQQHNFVVVH